MVPGQRFENLGLLVVLAAVWGASFLFIKVAVADIPPLTLVAGRVLLGCLALLLLLRLVGQALPRDRRLWLDFFVVALVGNVVPFFLIAWGELEIDSALAAILMGATPIAAVLLAHALTADEKLTPGKLAGVSLGFCGVVVLVGPEALRGLGRELWAQLAIVAAGCGYALGGIYTRRRGLTRLPPSVIACGVLLASSALVLPLALVLERPWRLAPGPDSLLALLALGLLSTGAAYLVLFRLLARAGVTFVALNNYLVPLFGMLLGALLLGEAVPPTALAALGLILLGVGLAQWPLREPAARARTAAAGKIQD